MLNHHIPTTLKCTLVLLAGLIAATSARAARPKKDVGLTVTAVPSHAMLTPGGQVEFKLTLAGEKKPSGATRLSLLPKGSADSVEIEIDAAGHGTWSFTVPADAQPGLVEFQLRHAGVGLVGTLAVDVIDQATRDAFEQAARRVKLKQIPARYLFIGDSLTDMARGKNYVDKLAFWLWKVHGGSVSVRNAGVGGDYILRVWQRLNHDKRAYRLAMYDNLYQPRPTRVFFFLGHNDCKLSSRSGYETPVVPIDQFEETYRLAVRKVQDATDARMTIISSTSSVYEITSATSKKRSEQGIANNLFGKPQALEQFNAAARRVAGQCGADYLDVYGPTKSWPNKPGLFTRDGVHLSNLGNRLVALKILEYLAGEN